MEKIDLTKCNNLRYKARIDGNDDYGRICVENADTGLAFLRSDREDDYIATWHCDCPGVEGFCGRKVTDFEIVPRDPETYQDWQVGDIACEEEHRNARYEVIFRSGELVFFKDWNNYATNPFTCSEAFRRFGFRLVLTDIEKQIIKERKKTELATARTLWGKPFNGTGKIWKPQDGDICFVENRVGSRYVFISAPGSETSYYVSYGGERRLSIKKLAVMYMVMEDKSIKILRPASDEEKQELFDALAKKGKRWNAEKKVVEDIQEPEELRAGKSEIKSEIKSGHQFKKGEPVLVRDSSNDIWKLMAFVEVNEDSRYPYRVENGNLRGMYRHCLPYNERTMHLLGTTEDYKEEQS